MTTTRSGKKIGLLTSGGDCAGLNAAIRAVVLRAAALDIEVIGIRDGTHGLLDSPPDIVPMTPDMIDSALIRRGGTILGTTNKGDPFNWVDEDGKRHDISNKLAKAVQDLNLDAIVGIGGDGSLAILSKLCAQAGVGLIGIPKTIDNDVAETESAIGFDTAVCVATEALDRLQPTAASHARVMILEVMGRDAGHIALHAGIAGGADIILIPEIDYTIQGVTDKITALHKSGRNFALIVVSEAVKAPHGKTVMTRYSNNQVRYGGVGQALAEQIMQQTGAEARVTVLGHVQRGAQPSPYDRIIASAFGVHAVDLANQGITSRMVAWSQRRVIDVPLEMVVAKSHEVMPDDSLLHTARALGIYMGSE